MEIALDKLTTIYISNLASSKLFNIRSRLVELVIGLKVALDCHRVLRACLICDVDTLDSVFDGFDLLLEETLSVACLSWGCELTLIDAFVLE